MSPRSFFASGRARVGLRVASLTLVAAGAALLATSPMSCAAGTELGSGGTSSAEESSSPSSPSSAASTTGAGGATSTSTSSGGGNGGAGGAGTGTSTTSGSSSASSSSASSSSASSSSASSSSASSSSASSSGSSSSSSSGSGGGSPTGTVLLLAGGGPKVLAGEYHPGVGWTATPLSSTTDKAPGIAITGANTAVGVIRNTAFGNEVAYTTWAPGSFQAFTSIANAVTTQAAPSIAASGTRADVAFLGDNNKHYYAARVATWSPTADPIGGAAAQSFGSSPAAVAAIGSDTIVAFVGSDGDLYDQTRTGTTWSAASSHTLGNTLSLMPAIIAPTAGPSLMIAYVRSTDAKILFTTRTGNAWTTPSLIDANSFTADPVALTALPNGEALLAFRGLDNAIYFSRYTPAGSPVWSPPAPFAVPNVTSPSRPALAAGVGGVDAEMGFINTIDGKAYHARLTGTMWSVPVMVGGTQLTTVSIASAP